MPDRIDPATRSLPSVWEEHTAQEFVHKDVDATMRTMAASPHVLTVPLLLGGRGRDGVREFYDRYFIGQTPQDLRLEPLSRTVDAERVVDEMIVSFTHDIDTPWILPGVAPTGRHIEVALVVIVAFRDGKIESEHLYWDQASVMAQAGLLASSGLPMTAAEQVRALRDSTEPLNALLATTA